MKELQVLQRRFGRMRVNYRGGVWSMAFANGMVVTGMNIIECVQKAKAVVD